MAFCDLMNTFYNRCKGPDQFNPRETSGTHTSGIQAEGKTRKTTASGERTELTQTCCRKVSTHTKLSNM
jgi:hypothetical protein